MRLSYHPRFASDLAEAARFYEEQQAGLGMAFITEAEEAIKLIAEHPRMWRVIAKDVRRYLLKRFPYAIHYRLADDAQVVRLLTIRHGARRPQAGLRRK
jgi:plasmid stabilization system protein ParE